MTGGPLAGVRVIELAGLAPVSMAGMMLADLGADVVRVDPAGPTRMLDFPPPEQDLLRRGRRSVSLDLKDARGSEVVLRLLADADILIEGFRPGVCERLGLDPGVCLERNPRLIFGRLTGWGQDGPLSMVPGHDLNYLAVAGALSQAGGDRHGPMPLLNYVGDFGAGTMLLVAGVLAALTSARSTGRGQVVDAAMVDGLAMFSAHTRALEQSGTIDLDEPATNFLQGAAPFYRTYRCRDGQFLAVGAVEPPFYSALCEAVGKTHWEDQWARESWSGRCHELATLFAQRDRDEWCADPRFANACLSPVLSMHEAPYAEHSRLRQSYACSGPVAAPAAAPRFSATPGRAGGLPTLPGQHTREVLDELGLDAVRIRSLLDGGVAAVRSEVPAPQEQP